MALFNNGYPATYPQMYVPQYQPITQNTAPAPQPQGSIIWVQGESGAKSYMVAPNSSVVLFDSEAQSVYLKSADASGMPSIKILDYTIREGGKTALRTPEVQREDKSTTYATKAELEAVLAQIEALKNQVKDKEERK